MLQSGHMPADARPRGRPKLDTTVLREQLDALRDTVAALTDSLTALGLKVQLLEERQAALQYRARQIEGQS